MKNSNHVKPWSVAYNEEFEDYDVVDAHDVVVVGGFDSEEDACLLAAAPDLLEVAQYVLDEFEAFNRDFLERIGLNVAQEKLTAAIAKAQPKARK